MAKPELNRLISLGTSGKWEEVLAATRSLAIDEFTDAEAAQILFFEGLALLHLGQPDQAQQAVQMGLEYTSTRPELLDLAARVANALGHVSEAAVFHERAMANAPEEIRPLLLINYAATLVSEEDFSGALKLVEEAELAGQGCYESSLLAARCHAGLGRHRDALIRFSEASRDRPTESAPRLGVANMLSVLGKSTQAEAMYAQLLGVAPDAEVAYNWAWSRLAQGDPMGAVKLCRSVPHDAPGAAALTCLHAKALLAMGAEEAALGLLARGIASLGLTRDNTVLYDDFSATEAETMAGLGQDAKARKRLASRIARFHRNLPRSQCVLALMNDPPENRPTLYEVTVESPAGDWHERLTVQAQDSTDALGLAMEVHVPDDFAAALTSIRPGGVIPSYARDLPPVRGVLERRFDAHRRRKLK